VFRDPEKDFPKEEGMTYIKLHLELKDWEYAKQIHEDLKIWKGKLKERYVHAGADGPVDTSKVAPGLRYRTFDTPATGLDPGKLSEMTLEDLFSEKLRMETTRTNKQTDPIYTTLVRLILERQEDLTQIIQAEIRPIQKSSDPEEFLQKRYRWQEEAKQKMREIEGRNQSGGVSNSSCSKVSKTSKTSKISKNIKNSKNIKLQKSKRPSTASSTSLKSDPLNHVKKSQKPDNQDNQTDNHLINNENHQEIHSNNINITSNVASENSQNSTTLNTPINTPIAKIQQISEAPPPLLSHLISHQVQDSNINEADDFEYIVTTGNAQTKHPDIQKDINRYQLEQRVSSQTRTHDSEPANISPDAIQQEDVDDHSSEVNNNSDEHKHENKSKASDYIT